MPDVGATQYNGHHGALHIFEKAPFQYLSSLWQFAMVARPLKKEVTAYVIDSSLQL